MNMADFKMTSQGPTARTICLRAPFIAYMMAAIALLPQVGQAQTVTATIAAGSIPAAAAANPVTNKIYVASGPITVIDGATNATTPLNTVPFPLPFALNPATNNIYFAY